MFDHVYINRDNIILLEFRSDGILTPLNAITQIDLVIEELDITISNSVSTSFPIKWQHNPIETGVLKIKIGDTENLLAGLYEGKFYIYSSNYPNGLFWQKINLLIDT